MSEIRSETLEKACEAGARALAAVQDNPWYSCDAVMRDNYRLDGDRHIRRALESAGPIVAAAAYRQGREDGLREASESFGRVQMPEHQGYGTYKGHFDAGVGACRAVLRSLLTDKEGE